MLIRVVLSPQKTPKPASKLANTLKTERNDYTEIIVYNWKKNTNISDLYNKQPIFNLRFCIANKKHGLINNNII